MPRFNFKGDWTAGVGGTSPVIINGNIVATPPSGIAANDWINNDEVLSASWTGWDNYHAVAISKSGGRRILWSGVHGRAAAGGNRWAVLPADAPGIPVADKRWLLDDGTRIDLPVVCLGREDGCVVTWLTEAGGLVVDGRVVAQSNTAAGTSIDSWNPTWDVTVFTKDVAIWRDRSGLHVIGMPHPNLLPGNFSGLRVAQHNGEWWAIYQAEALGHLVVHPFSGPEQGYVINEKWTGPNSEGEAFRPDIASVNGELLAVWSVREGEAPGTNRFKRQLEFGPIRNLTVNGTGDPPQPPSPPPPPPEKKPLEVPNLSSIVTEAWDFYNMELRQESAYNEGGKPAILRLQMHWFAALTPRVQKALPSGWEAKWEHYRNPVPGTNWHWLPDQFLLKDPNGIIHSVKVITGKGAEWHNKRGIENWTFGSPAWMDLGVPGPENYTTSDPVHDPQPQALGPSPFDSVVEPPAKPEDHKPPTQDLSELKTRIDVLEKQNEAIGKALLAAISEIDALKTREYAVTLSPANPGDSEAFSINTSRDWSHSHVIRLKLHTVQKK